MASRLSSWLSSSSSAAPAACTDWLTDSSFSFASASWAAVDSASFFCLPASPVILSSTLPEEFILELPLKKIWGIGEKTLEKLHSVGIFTKSSFLT
ncbi:MAG: hypothetical protein IIX05_01060, partial [Selenomonadaceae bacterium]|nr:hypothetical protein [Selenomonadaceae bacterium]